MDFIKSTFCGGGDGCVEVAMRADSVTVRGSDEHGAVLRFTPREWEQFIAGVKAGEFDQR